MTTVQAGILLVATLSAGLVCPMAAADAEHGRRHADPPTSARADDAAIAETPVGPPDYNGCRPYCR